MRAKKLIVLVFETGMDAMIYVDSTKLADCGFPRHVLAAYPEVLPLRLDPAWFHMMDVRFETDDVLVCRMSFDALYEVRIPHAAITHVTVMFDGQEVEAPKKPEKPSLRLVE